jgi:hypothetical protein
MSRGPKAPHRDEAPAPEAPRRLPFGLVKDQDRTGDMFRDLGLNWYPRDLRLG